jgi:MFS transporter, FHS family, glucose/mannose:H+ symporter
LIAVAGILTFVLLGTIQSLYGPLLPGLQRSFGVGTGTAGLVFAAHGLGALAGILLPSLLRGAALAGRWLSVATGLLLVGAACISAAPTWPAMLAGAFVLAVGFGIHVVRLNSLFVAGFGRRGMAMSLLINAAFSVGAILGPIVVALSGEPSRRLFVGVAAGAAILVPVNVAADRRGRSVISAVLGHSGDRKRARARTVLIAFAALMCLTSGAENCIGGWIATLALANGYAFSSAANLTAVFFGSIFAGRLLAAGVGHRLQPGILVMAAIGCVASLLVLASVSHSSVALALAGFAFAPIFSATLVWLGGALPTSAHANALVIAGALLGAASFPPLVGRIIGELGATAGPPAILCITLAALAVAAGIHLARRR